MGERTVQAKVFVRAFLFAAITTSFALFSSQDLQIYSPGSLFSVKVRTKRMLDAGGRSLELVKTLLLFTSPTPPF